MYLDGAMGNLSLVSLRGPTGQRRIWRRGGGGGGENISGYLQDSQSIS